MPAMRKTGSRQALTCAIGLKSAVAPASDKGVQQARVEPAIREMQDWRLRLPAIASARGNERGQVGTLRASCRP